MNFEEKQDLYAKLLVQQGLNVQEGQDVYINAEVVHRDFVTKIVKAAYLKGARVVVVDFYDPRNLRTRILESTSTEFLSYVPPVVPFRYDSMIPETAASLRLIGSEFPDILQDVDSKKAHTVELSFRKSLKRYYDEAVGHSKVQWLVAAAATPAWGQKVFPHLSPEKAHMALWDAIFHICRADKPNCLDLWQKHNQVLHDRAQKLTDMKIQYLHFKGPGTDLKVGLSPHARFAGGTKLSARKVPFEANIPTEECFTTPDYRMTEGHVATTRPFIIGGKKIVDLHLTFKGGNIVDFKAKEGQETIREYIQSDPGAKRLGEVALVGIDSPIYQSGAVFEEILFDENAACHIAVGFAYRHCIKEGTKMSPEELEQIGCNTSQVHTDMMISSNQVDVEALLYSGETVPLLKKGAWV